MRQQASLLRIYPTGDELSTETQKIVYVANVLTQSKTNCSVGQGNPAALGFPPVAYTLCTLSRSSLCLGWTQKGRDNQFHYSRLVDL